MLIENFVPDTNSKEPIYLQIGQFIKTEIHKGQLLPGTKLPSLRHLARSLKISRTTAETCYGQLIAEGYLESRPQKGYYVVDLLFSRPAPVSPSLFSEQQAVQYDFANNYVDATTFPATVWRRHLNQVLHDSEALSLYGDPQGEAALRRVLATYSHESRGVLCTPEQIIVGAGVQSLLEILAALLSDTLFANVSPAAENPGNGNRVGAVPSPLAAVSRPALALEEPGFPQAEEIFRRQHWDVSHFDTEELNEDLPRLLYVSPSNPYKGRSLTPEQRRRLLRWSNSRDTFILEDDYNGEFRYFSTPVSSLQGMGDGRHIFYLGSFSRLLLPGLRISYLVLPDFLLPAYRKLKPLYNQTAGTIEQLALAGFIREGSLRRHVKKLRRLYKEKNTLLRRYLQQYFGSRIKVLAYESGLHMRISVKSSLSSVQLTERALLNGVKVIPVRKESPLPELLLSFAGIREQDIKPAVMLLHASWKE